MKKEKPRIHTNGILSHTNRVKDCELKKVDRSYQEWDSISEMESNSEQMKF